MSTDKNLDAKKRATAAQRFDPDYRDPPPPFAMISQSSVRLSDDAQSASIQTTKDLSCPT